VLAARIDRLSLEEKRLLQTAAVIGMEIPLALLQAIAELPEEALHRGLTHLQAAEFLYETRLFPEHAYTFKHALTHEVAYRSLLQERRRTLHARIVEALETLTSDRLADHIERLADHAVRGEVWARLSGIADRQGRRPWSARQRAKPWGVTNRPWRPWSIYWSDASCMSRPSIYGLTCVVRALSSGSMRVSCPTSAPLKRWRKRWTIRAGLDGSPSIWPIAS
jgi:hypothetical protein